MWITASKIRRERKKQLFHLASALCAYVLGKFFVGGKKCAQEEGISWRERKNNVYTRFQKCSKCKTQRFLLKDEKKTSDNYDVRMEAANERRVTNCSGALAWID